MKAWVDVSENYSNTVKQVMNSGGAENILRGKTQLACEWGLSRVSAAYNCVFSFCALLSYIAIEIYTSFSTIIELIYRCTLKQLDNCHSDLLQIKITIIVSSDIYYFLELSAYDVFFPLPINYISFLRPEEWYFPSTNILRQRVAIGFNCSTYVWRRNIGF